MHDYSPNEVAVGFKGLDFFSGMIIEDSNLKIIRSTKNPVFFRKEFDGPDGEGGGLQGLDGDLDAGWNTLAE
jgi:hypothetical protein